MRAVFFITVHKAHFFFVGKGPIGLKAGFETILDIDGSPRMSHNNITYPAIGLLNEKELLGANVLIN
jgi:hypothetical protein